MEEISRPIACNARMADSRPEPGPLTLTSTSFMPCDMACRAASWATCCAAKAVLLREPLKPTRPALDQPKTLPCWSVMVTCVLLKVAKMLAIPVVIFLEPLALMIFFAAASSASNSAAVGAAGAVAGAAGRASAVLATSEAAAAGAAFLGALAVLASGAALGASAAPGVSGLASFFTAGFLGLVSSAINEIQSVDACLRIWIALHADGLAGSLSGAGIGLCALAAHRQSTQMTDAAITLDGLEPLQVQANFTAKG